MRPVHHIGIVLRNERAMQQFMSTMALEEDYRGTVPEWNALCVFTKAAPGSSPSVTVRPTVPKYQLSFLP